MPIALLFTLLFASTPPASAQWRSEVEMLRSLQPDVARLQKVEAASLTLLGRGIMAESGGTANLALVCLELDLPGDILARAPCNALQVIYFKDHQAYRLSLPVAGDPHTDAASLPVVANRLFQKFIPLLAEKAPTEFTRASFDQRGWNWSAEPVKVPEADFLRAVLGITQSLEPRRLRAAHRDIILPSYNWRLWADERYLDQMTLFL